MSERTQSAVHAPILEGLDPRLRELGQLIGLLNPFAPDDPRCTLQMDWFQDPMANIRGITDNPRALLDVIVSLLGPAEPSPLGSSRLWHPIQYPISGQPTPTGLYLITDSVTSFDGDTDKAPCHLAFGARYKFTSGDDDPISVTVRLQLPLLDLASGEFLLEPDKEPIVLTVQLGGGKGAFRITEKEHKEPPKFALDGLDLTVTLHLDKPPAVDLILRRFSLGGAAPKDLSIVELAKDPEQLIGDRLRAVVLEALRLATDAALKGKPEAEQAKVRAMEADVLWLLGLNKSSANEQVIPEVSWSKLAGTGFGEEWSRWFDSILTNPKTLKAWLHGVYCLTHGLDATTRKAHRDIDLGGTGTAADPFAVSIVDGGTGGPLVQLTLSTGQGTLTPGLRVVSPAIHPTDEIDLIIEASAQLGDISFGGSSNSALRPAFQLSVNAKQNEGVLFTYTDDDEAQSISPSQFEAGLRFTQSGGAKLTPFADFKGSNGNTKSIIDLWQQANPLDDPLDWLLGKLQDEEFWEHVFTQLLPDDSGFACGERGIEFEKASTVGTTLTEGGGQPVSLKLSAGGAGEKGLAVGVDTRTAIEWLALSLQAGLSFADVTMLDGLSLTFKASIGGQENSNPPLPRLTASLGLEGDFQLVVEFPLAGAPEPLRLSLVPFKGLEGFSIDDVWPVLEGAILDSTSVKAWLESPLNKGVEHCTWASILTEWPLLRKDNGNYRFPRTKEDKTVDVGALEALRPDKLIEVALTQLLSHGEELPLLKIDEHDGLYLTHTHDQSGSCYGARLAVSNLVVAGREDRAGKDESLKGNGDEQPKRTTITLQAGKWMSGEKARENWLTRSGIISPPAGGIHLDLLAIENGEPVFSPGLKLVSVGVDVAGTDKKPLFDVKGYRVEGIQSRLYLDTNAKPVQIGGGVRLDRAAIPLGPSTGADTGSNNPVASGLLSSGGRKETKGDAGDPVNPVFGVQVSYLENFDGQILSDDPKAGGKVWIPIKNSFGPLYCRKVGFGFDEERRLLVGYDGSVALGPLGIDLMDLSVGIPLKTPQEFSKYTLDLRGLDLTFDGGPVETSGSFLESRFPDTADGVVQYTGTAMIKTEAFSITGLGSYSVVGGAPSLFVFAVLNKDLGGPTFFFVTALASGFGFKRKLILPSIEQVEDFPLVKVITEPDYIEDSTDPKAALQKLSECIPPDPAAYWLAVGLRIRSFEQIETVALLSVSFGSDVTISVLGLSTLTIPSNLKEGQSPLCYAELALRAELNPGVGVLSVEGRLTSKSYIFDEDCKLTGGFAFSTWFQGNHEGDFIVTLGGYHPRFVPPPHYPVVPRVGIAWIVSNQVRITGELYFAFTPSCLMAGGKLSAVYDGGWARAWFVAYADFLISWKPFHYDTAIGVTIGASVTVSVNVGLFKISKTFAFELGADLHLWGPPFAGTARIKFYIVSFTISFGDQGRHEPPPLDWVEFSKSFLPNPSAVCGVVFTGGLIQEWKRDDGKPVAIVNGHELSFNVQSTAPCTAIHWNQKEESEHGSDDWAGKLGVTPMFANDLESALSAELKAHDGTTLDSDLFSISVVRKGFPAALWGQGKPSLSEPTSEVLHSVPAGVAVALSEGGKQWQIRHSLPAMALEEFKYERIPKTIPWTGTPLPGDIMAPGTHTLSNTIWDNDEVRARRNSVLTALAGVTPYPLNEVSLPQTAARAATIFQTEPTFATLGQLLPEEK